MPAASAMPARGTPLAEKKDFKASSKSSGDTEAPPLLAVRMAANSEGWNGTGRSNGEEIRIQKNKNCRKRENI